MQFLKQYTIFVVAASSLEFVIIKNGGFITVQKCHKYECSFSKNIICTQYYICFFLTFTAFLLALLSYIEKAAAV
jgi:hypothetical protein